MVEVGGGGVNFFCHCHKFMWTSGFSHEAVIVFLGWDIRDDGYLLVLIYSVRAALWSWAQISRAVETSWNIKMRSYYYDHAFYAWCLSILKGSMVFWTCTRSWAHLFVWRWCGRNIIATSSDYVQIKKNNNLLQEFTRSKNKIIHIFSSFRCGASRVHSFGHIRTDLGLKKTEGRVFPSKMDRRKLLTVRDTSRFLKIYTWSKLRETLNNVRNILRATFLKSDSLNVKYLIISNANQETSVKENKRKR